MTEPSTTPGPPVYLGEPLPDPDPAPGCKRCGQLDAQRAAARAAGDWTQVSDCNVQIRRCVH